MYFLILLLSSFLILLPSPKSANYHLLDPYQSSIILSLSPKSSY